MAIRGAKKILALKNKKVREAEGRFLIEGVRLCEEALSSPAEVEQVLFAREALESERLRSLIERARARGVLIQETDRRALGAFCEAVTPQGIVAVMGRRQWDRGRLPNPEGPAVVLDHIRDPGNVGMILRTAEAAGASAVFLTEGSVELHNPKAVRASMGAIFRVPAFERVGLAETLNLLRRDGFRVLAADVRAGVSYRDVRPGGGMALLFGGEATGLEPEVRGLVDEVVHIPMRGEAESLNVAVAAGILLYGMVKAEKEKG
ncbi:MAG: RNA methyltransferase [Candidatus Latescibacteria bacterium]|nr:RNA methyltransferase [Candidatus Latescibacterota bacterium]